MIPAPGTMLDENLRLLRLLGRGGMGSVWLAEHLTLKHEVAVKLLSPELTREPEALERFRREATAVAQLKSPHVVQIHDLGTKEGTPYFVMERLEGEDLSQRLQRAVGRKLPIGIVGAVVVQTCKGLARVHELGVVHRDLKPGNIFLTDVDGDLVIKLLDFGVAKTTLVSSGQTMHQTSDQSILGTPLYMSPEQILSPKNVSAKTDLWALGVVAYECLAGRPPFDGETIAAIHIAIAGGTFTPITTVNPSLPRTLDAWFARALAALPENRFRSPREMSDAFLAAARGQSIGLDSYPMPVAGAVTPRREHTSLPAVALSPAAPSAGAGRFAAPIAAGAIVLALAAVGLAAIGRSSSPAPPHANATPALSESAPPPPAAPSSSITIIEKSSASSDADLPNVPAVPASALPNSRGMNGPSGGGGGFRPPAKKKDRGF